MLAICPLDCHHAGPAWTQIPRYPTVARRSVCCCDSDSGGGGGGSDSAARRAERSRTIKFQLELFTDEQANLSQAVNGQSGPAVEHACSHLAPSTNPRHIPFPILLFPFPLTLHHHHHTSISKLGCAHREHTMCTLCTLCTLCTPCAHRPSDSLRPKLRF